ncbi:hypothetical protein P7C70_g3775, partial [Phenoliferia sp. Uapishka_3]
MIALGGAIGTGLIIGSGTALARAGPVGMLIGYTNETGVFLGVWAVMVNALFAYMGSELVGVTFGEAKNPRKTVPATIRRRVLSKSDQKILDLAVPCLGRTFWRLLIFYIGSVFVIGLIVPSNDPRLLSANKKSTSAAASPFVVAASVAGIRILPQILNAAILVFVLSASNTDLYIGSRTLYALAAEKKAPAIFLRCNRMGVPYVALALCSAFTSLAYLNVSTSSKLVFSYFTSFTTVFGAITWMGILFAHIRFMKALKAQGISRDTLPYKAWGQPYLAWAALCVTAIVTFFKGFDSFVPKFHYITFITNYLGAVVFVFMYIGWKLWHKTSMIPLTEVDLVTGKRDFDEDEAACKAAEAMAPPKSIWQKIWNGA